MPPVTHDIDIPDGATSFTITFPSRPQDEAQGPKSSRGHTPSRTPVNGSLHDAAGRPTGMLRWSGDNVAEFANWLTPNQHRGITGLPVGWTIEKAHADGKTLFLTYAGHLFTLREGEGLSISSDGHAETHARWTAPDRGADAPGTRTYHDLVKDALRQLQDEMAQIDAKKWTQAWHDLGALEQVTLQQRRTLLAAEIEGLRQVLELGKAPPADAEPGFITRMREELDHLGDRYAKLRHFMGSEQATTLEPRDRELLAEQARAMHLYAEALGERFKRALAKHVEGKARDDN